MSISNTLSASTILAKRAPKSGLPIKLFSAMLALFVSFTGNPAFAKLYSKSENPGMTKIFYEVEINAPKEKVWDIIENFGDLSWSETVVDVHYIGDTRGDVGMTRHCDLPKDKFIVERITKWNQGSDYTYVIDDASDPITNDSYATWVVSERDGKTFASFEVHYDIKYGVIGNLMNVIAKRQFAKQIPVFMNELRDFAEA